VVKQRFLFESWMPCHYLLWHCCCFSGNRGESCCAVHLFLHSGALSSTSERRRDGICWASEQGDCFWEKGHWASNFIVALLSYWQACTF
jgi:hypothetical protein